MSIYKHEPLPEGSARLLRLLPYSSEHPGIRCQLITCPLLKSQNTHSYEALSYVWGPTDNQQSIQIDGCEFPIRANLHAALSHLQDTLIDRILWIDAICINQEDDNERGHQVQSMASIYAQASCVIVWLGEEADKSNEALEAIRAAAAGQSMELSDESSITTLLQRPWFRRIWVLQEVAAARHILIKCGRTEIDGYALCAGLSKLQISAKIHPNLASIINPIAYLIRGAVFRPRHKAYETSQSGGFSLNIRPLIELLDMYHNREATERLDKIYALLGMSSDNPDDLKAAGLIPDYAMSWKEIFRNLVQFSVSNQISVYTWENNEAAVIKSKGCILGKVSSVEEHTTEYDSKIVNIISRSHMITRKVTIPVSARHIQKGDGICLLQGASKPSIIRPCSGYFIIVMIAAPLLDLGSWVMTIPHDLRLIWDWDAFEDKLQEEEYHERLIGSSERPRCPKIECNCQHYRDEATGCWEFGMLLNALEEYEEANKSLQKAVKAYGTASRCTDKSHGLWTGVDERALRIMNDLFLEAENACIKSKDKGGMTPLLHAVESDDDIFHLILLEKCADFELDYFRMTPLMLALWYGIEDFVQILLDEGANIESRGGNRETALMHAICSGNEASVQMLLDKGASILSKDITDTTPLLCATMRGLPAIMRLLLDKSADYESMLGFDPIAWRIAYTEGGYRFERTPLWHAADGGKETAVKLLLDRHAIVDSRDWQGETPLFRAVERGHEGIVRLLIENGADINLKDMSNSTPLDRATLMGHQAVAELLRENGALVSQVAL